MLRLHLRSRLCAYGLALLLAACSAPVAAPLAPALQPELPSGYSSKPGWSTHHYAVAAANPLATQSGLQILQAGGSAVDAAVAVQMVLALVEPQSSGLGGGAFLLHFDGQQVQAFDGRETAPAGATPTLFLRPDGSPMAFKQAVVGGRAVGVPGAIAMLALAQGQHGRLPWAQLFAPAIALARDGFAVSPRMAALLAAEPDLPQDPVARTYFYDRQGHPWPAGHWLRNPELAEVLQGIAKQGPDALLRGPVAQAIASKVRQHPSNPGSLSTNDLANYRAVERPALCFAYQAAQRHLRICGMPPPSSGALAIGQILGMLQHTAAAGLALQNGLPPAHWLHLYTEASRLAFADRAAYVADPDFVQAPGQDWSSLLDPDYLAQRAHAIHAERRMELAPAGEPGTQRLGYAPMPEQIEHGTSHISVVDRYGNALSMTTTIEDAWGSRLMVNRGLGLAGGFLLNNQLTDFSFAPTDGAGKPVANRVQPGKRPRSSMAPTLVFDVDSGQLLMTLGSPGGAFIIHFTAKALYAQLHWGLTPQQAVDLPNFGTLGGPLLLERGRFPDTTVQALQALGHTVQQVELTSGLQAIARAPHGFLGGADPRREGEVAGD